MDNDNDTEDKLPAITLTFKEHRGRASLLHYLNQIENGKSVNPSIALMLDCLALPIERHYVEDTREK